MWPLPVHITSNRDHDEPRWRWLVVAAVIGACLVWTWLVGRADDAWLALAIHTAVMSAGALVAMQIAVGASSRPWLALIATLAGIGVMPAHGSEVAFLSFAGLLWVAARYIERPGHIRFWLLTAWTIAVGAIRGDYVILVVTAALATFVGAHRRADLRATRRAVLDYAGTIAVAVLLVVPLGQLPTAADRVQQHLASAFPVVASSTETPRPAAAPDPPTFNIRWAPGVDGSARAAKEQAYGLLDGQADATDPGGRTWRYRWAYWPAEDVIRMLRDPAIEDTHRIDRATGRYVSTSPTPAARYVEPVPPWLTWLWMLLPAAALLRMAVFLRRRGAARNSTAAPNAAVAPALAVCVCAGLSVTSAGADPAGMASSATPAAIVVAAWLGGTFARPR